MNEQEHTEQDGAEDLVMDEKNDEQPKGEGENKSARDGNPENTGEKESVKDAAAELKATEDKYLRLYAEFDNFRRRTAAERLELFRTAGAEMLVALLPVMDDFERALKAMDKAGESDAVRQGVDLVYNKLKTILTQKGVKPMDAIGKEFDSEFHEAVTKIPAPSEELKGKVVDELEKGYFLNDKVIRFAKVIVGE